MSENKCAFPNCPSAESLKILHDRHEEIRGHLGIIEEGQKAMIVVMTNVATLLANVQNLTRDLNKNDTEHNEIFLRLRAVENKQWWMIGLGIGIIAVIEILFKFFIK
jgi:hypothetical protein